MEPTEALSTVETVLRNAIRVVYPGSTWLEAKGAPAKEELEERLRVDSKKRDGVVAPESLLDFAFTYDLVELVLKNWEDFKPVFDDLQRTTTYFGIVGDIRNSIAHSRPLVPFERDLISGIAGQLGNQVSLYSSGRDGSRDFYPTIESLRDSFGNDSRDNAWDFVSPRQRLDVGQVLHISGRAVDPRGRGVRWHLRRENVSQERYGIDPIAEGTELEYGYTVTAYDVSENFQLRIVLSGSSAFSRNMFDTAIGLAYDDDGCFAYSVNPPDWEWPPLHPPSETSEPDVPGDGQPEVEA